MLAISKYKYPQQLIGPRLWPRTSTHRQLIRLVRAARRLTRHTLLGQRGQKIVTDFEPDYLSSGSPIDKYYLSRGTDFGVASEAAAARKHLNAILLEDFFRFEIVERAVVRSQNLCSDKNLELKIKYDTELVPDWVQSEEDW